jgi:hypothetical protein
MRDLVAYLTLWGLLSGGEVECAGSRAGRRRRAKAGKRADLTGFGKACQTASTFVPCLGGDKHENVEPAMPPSAA